MGIEDRRKKLLANGPKWGDRPQRRPHHVATVQPREEPQCGCLQATTRRASTPDALTIQDMNRVLDPLPPPNKCTISTYDWSLDNLVKYSDRFHPIPRISSSNSALTTKIDEFEKNGVPIIIEGLHKHPKWPKEQFNLDWFALHGGKDISVRNVHDWSDKTIPLAEFITKSRAAPKFADAEEQERLYGKDAECPDQWDKWLHDSKVIPASLLPDGPNNLLLQQPPSQNVETLMCYLGIGDTFTPCHKDLCASSGQNLMCYTENGGSSFWFMTKSADAPEASKYFWKMGQELDHETHVITIKQLTAAPFDIYIAEQKLGDLVLVPPRSCHQVVNYGGMTLKTSWSRMTFKGLETAYYHELPIYRRVCRPETYRVKSTIYYTLLSKTDKLQKLGKSQTRARVVADLRKALALFDDIIIDEYSPGHANMPHLLPSTSPKSRSSHSSKTKTEEDLSSPISCDFCGADVFQSFFECRGCVPQNGTLGNQVAHGDGYVVCAGCYVEGRSCRCGVMEAMQYRQFKELLDNRNKAAALLLTARTKETIPAVDYRNFGKGTFRAACVLREIRKEGKRLDKDGKVCHLPKGGDVNHAVPFPWALSCKKCHSSKCFMHILLDQKQHAADALLNHSQDSTHEQHHQSHRSSAETFDDAKESFLSSQKTGSKPDLRQQRIHAALDYGTCKPINPEFMRLGFYDRNAQILHLEKTPGQHQERMGVAEEVSTPTPPVQEAQPVSLSPSPQSPVADPKPISANPAPAALNLATKPLGKRKRDVLDFVLMPSPSYKIKRPIVPIPIVSELPEPVDIREASAESSPLTSVDDLPPLIDNISPPPAPALTPSVQSSSIQEVSSSDTMVDEPLSPSFLLPREPTLPIEPPPPMETHLPTAVKISRKRKSKAETVAVSRPTRRVDETAERPSKRSHTEKQVVTSKSLRIKQGLSKSHTRPERRLSTPPSSTSSVYPRSTDSGQGLADVFNRATANNISMSMDDPQQTPSTSSVNVPKPADEYVTIQEKVAILTQLASIEAQNAQIMRHLQRPPTPPPIQMASAQVPPYMAELIVQVVTGLQQRGQPHPQHAQSFPGGVWQDGQPWPMPTPYMDQPRAYYEHPPIVRERDYHYPPTHGHWEHPEEAPAGPSRHEDRRYSRYYRDNYAEGLDGNHYTERRDNGTISNRRMELHHNKRPGSHRYTNAVPHRQPTLTERIAPAPERRKEIYTRPEPDPQTQTVKTPAPSTAPPRLQRPQRPSRFGMGPMEKRNSNNRHQSTSEAREKTLAEISRPPSAPRRRDKDVVEADPPALAQTSSQLTYKDVDTPRQTGGEGSRERHTTPEDEQCWEQGYEKADEVSPPVRKVFRDSLRPRSNHTTDVDALMGNPWR